MCYLNETTLMSMLNLTHCPMIMHNHLAMLLNVWPLVSTKQHKHLQVFI